MSRSEQDHGSEEARRRAEGADGVSPESETCGDQETNLDTDLDTDLDEKLGRGRHREDPDDPAAEGLVSRSILAPRGDEQSRVLEGRGASGAALGAAETAFERGQGFLFRLRGLGREHVAPIIALGALFIGITLIGIAAPWSPFGPAGGQQADAQTSSGGSTGISSGTSDGSTSGGSGGSGGFAPSVLPQGSAGGDTGGSTNSSPLPQAHPGGSNADRASGAGGGATDSILPGTTGATTAAAGGTVGCADYASQADAQAALQAGASQLDQNGNGQACELYFGTGYTGQTFADTGGMSELVPWAKGGGLLMVAVGLLGLAGVGLRRVIAGARN